MEALRFAVDYTANNGQNIDSYLGGCTGSGTDYTCIYPNYKKEEEKLYKAKPKTVSCSGGTCTVQNFILRQDVSKPEEWIGGMGDPQFIVFYEAFPHGEETAWRIGEDTFLGKTMLIAGALNIIPLVGTVSKPIARKAVASLSKRIAEKEYLRIAFELLSKKTPNFLKKSVERFLFTHSDEFLEVSSTISKNIYDEAILAGFTRHEVPEITNEIISRKVMMESDDEIAKALATKYKNIPEDKIKKVVTKSGDVETNIELNMKRIFKEQPIKGDRLRFFKKMNDVLSGLFMKEGDDIIERMPLKTQFKAIWDDKLEYDLKMLSALGESPKKFEATKTFYSELSEKTDDIYEIIQKNLKDKPLDLSDRAFISSKIYSDPKIRNIFDNYYDAIAVSGPARELETANFFDIFIKNIDNINQNILKEAAEKGTTKIAIMEAAKKAFKENARKSVAVAYNKLKLMTPEAKKKVLSSISLAFEHTPTAIKNGRATKLLLIESIDDADLLAGDEKTKISGTDYNTNLPLAVESLVEDVAKCMILFKGKGGRTTCAVLIAVGVLAETSDSSAKKFEPVGINALGFFSPFKDTIVRDLSTKTAAYYIELGRSMPLVGGEGGNVRFYLASPCETDLIIKKETAKCAFTKCEDIDCSGFDNEIQCKEILCGKNPWYQSGLFGGGSDIPYTKNKWYKTGIPPDTSPKVIQMIEVPNWVETIKEGYKEWGLDECKNQQKPECYVPSKQKDGINTPGIKICQSQSLFGQSIELIELHKDTSDVDAISIEPSNKKGFCFKKSAFKQQIYKTINFAFWIAADTVATAVLGGCSLTGVGAPVCLPALGAVYATTGAATIYTEYKIEERGLWPKE